MYQPGEIADWFLAAVDRGAGDSITHLKLQKLVFYAQAWALALLGRPLFDEEVQAWAHGPVVPSLWLRFRDHRWDALPPPRELPELDPETTELLADVMDTYGEHSASRLEELTHSEEPWIRARRGRAPEERCTEIIPKEHMRDFYRALYDRVG